jgi:hypothetical protein
MVHAEPSSTSVYIIIPRVWLLGREQIFFNEDNIIRRPDMTKGRTKVPPLQISFPRTHEVATEVAVFDIVSDDTTHLRFSPIRIKRFFYPIQMGQFLLRFVAGISDIYIIPKVVRRDEGVDLDRWIWDATAATDTVVPNASR